MEFSSLNKNKILSSFASFKMFLFIPIHKQKNVFYDDDNLHSLIIHLDTLKHIYMLKHFYEFHPSFKLENSWSPWIGLLHWFIILLSIDSGHQCLIENDKMLHLRADLH